MDLKVLRYFVEIASRGNFTAAAEALNLTQPTLSKQIMELEAELGVRLLVRGKRRTTLTEAGGRLMTNARELLELAELTKKRVGGEDSPPRGEVHIAGGETRTMRLAARAMHKTIDKYPDIKFHIYSGNAEAVAERLEKGLADFGAFVLPANLEKFDYIILPCQDIWGALIRKDHPLASRATVRPEDLAETPLIVSSQSLARNEINGWLGEAIKPRVVATYTLLYNAALMVREGAGVALCIDGIADISSSSELRFRPFAPSLKSSVAIAWKKDRGFSVAASIFLDSLRYEIGSGANNN